MLDDQEIETLIKNPPFDDFLVPRKPHIYFKEYFTEEPFSMFEEGSAILIGSSGRLLYNTTPVNDYDYIVRMNTAPHNGFTEKVGSRTDIRIVAFNSLHKVIVKHGLMNDLKYMFVWSGVDDFEGTVKLIKKAKRKYPDIKYYYFTEFGYNCVMSEFEAEYGSKNWLSTGIIAVFIMNILFSSFDILGFGDFNGNLGNKIPYHYWKDQLANQSEVGHYLSNQNARFGHRFLTEKQIILKWRKDWSNFRIL